MAFWDAVKKGAQKVSDSAVKVSDEVKRREELKKKKTKVLKRFSLRQLQYMAKNYGVKVQSQELILFDDEKPKLTFNDYVACIRSDLSYEEILEYAKNRKINLSDILREDKKTKNLSNQAPKPVKEFLDSGNVYSEESQVKLVLEKIEHMFDSSFKFVDELDFENHIFTLLNYEYGKKGWSIERQVNCGEYKDKIDIVLGNTNNNFEMAIELKIGHNKTHIRNSLGQLHTYAKHYQNTVLVTLDIGKIDSLYYTQFRNDLDKFGVSLLVLEGNLRSKKKEKKATIKFS